MSKVRSKRKLQPGALVIGAGISGISASLDLAERGCSVHLVEKTPSIGGKMAQLDKTFPTLDCSICILAPKMVEVSRHPNINLYTYSEVEKVERLNNGAFKVTILHKPRFVNEEKCTGCMVCIEKCPAKASNEFNAGLDERKAIYIPFPQAVPLVTTIDKQNCLYFTKNICKVCQRFCPADAVNFEDKERRTTIEVSSIIVSTGYDLLDPSMLTQYGYGRFPDVITSLEFERMMNVTGPTGGEIHKPSDNHRPNHIVFIQCVGSRNETVKPYCSQICCTYAGKQAVITKEHDPQIDITIMYNDLRARAKGHDEFLRRTEEEFGIKYVKGLPGEIVMDPKTKKLTIQSIDMDKNEIQTINADIVVLCPAATPSKGSEILAKTLGVKVDDYGFFKSPDPLDPSRTNVPDIFACGAAEGPKCITTSVTQASAAAAESLLKSPPKRGYQPPLDVKTSLPVEGEPKVGVFICHCGINIASVVDVKGVTEYAKRLPDVTYTEDLLFACSKDAQEVIKNRLKEKDLNRVVVASCTPRTHAPLFMKTLQEGGLNPYLFEMVNIREHDSWVHPEYPEQATEKAKDLVRMAVAKVRLANPLEPIIAKVTPSALVIGGGLSGLTAAKTIAESGKKVHLLEKSDLLGGRMRNEKKIPLEDVNGNRFLKNLITELENHRHVKLYKSARLTEIKGTVGDYTATFLWKGEEKTINVGVIVLATGSERLTPKEYYGYGEREEVSTLQEFEKKMKKGSIRGKRAVVYINCVGVREKEGRTFCSSTCCSESLDQAIRLKERNPNVEVHILYQHMRLPFRKEALYREAREKGIIFTRYISEKPPELVAGKRGLGIEVSDYTLNRDLTIPINHVVLASPLIPPEDNLDLAQMAKVPLATNGFYLEAHPKLRPFDFSTDGIYLCGTAHSPQSLDEVIAQAQAAASHALVTISRDIVVNEPIIAVVDEDKCIGCGNCEPVCPYNAVKIEKRVPSEAHGVKGVSEIDPLLCKGCGSCVVECPEKAITMQYFRDEQLSEMIDSSLTPPPKPGQIRILAFLCNWCAYAGADTAGVSRFKYPTNLRVMRVMCSGRVDELHILEAFNKGFDGVLVAGCHPSDCHYISGNDNAKRRIERLKKLLEKTGFESDRLRLEWISAGEGKRFADTVKELTEAITAMGPSPLRKGPPESSKRKGVVRTKVTSK